MKNFTNGQLRKLFLVAFSTFLFSVFANAQTDRYWSGGSGSSDNIDQGANWYGGVNPSSGDNLYFNNTITRHWAYSNYGLGSFFNFFITYNGAGGIKLYGDNTYAKKFENNNDGSLLELSPSSAAAGSREIGNRINNDLEINPVGTGGILVSCDKISMDNQGGARNLRVYGNNTLTINGSIYEKNGAGATFQIMNSATVELKGNSTFTGLTTINGGILKLNAAGGALFPGNAVTVNGGTLRVMQSQTIGNLTMTSGTLQVDPGTTLTITGTYNVSGATINNQGTIVLQGAAAQSFPGTTTTINNGTAGQMTNLTINNAAGVTINKVFTVAGNLTLSNGVVSTPGNIQMGTGSTVIRTGGSIPSGLSYAGTYNVQYNQHTASITVGPELSGGVLVFTTITNVKVSSTNGVLLTGSAYINGNLTVDPSCSFTFTPAGAQNLSLNSANAAIINNGTFTANANSTLIVNGTNNSITGTVTLYNVNIIAGKSLNLAANNNVINGVLSMAALSGGLVGNAPIYGAGSQLFYTGSGAMTRGLEWSADLSTSPVFGTTPGYPNEVKLSTTSLDLGAGSVERPVKSALTLVNGYITTGSNIVVLVAGATASSINNSRVNGNLQRYINASGTWAFYVGDAVNYTPASLNIPASGFAAGYLRLSTRQGINTASGFGTLSLLSSDCINRVWTLTIPSGSTFTGSYTGTFNYVPGDVLGSPVILSLRTGIYIGSMWRYFVTLSAPASQVSTAAGIIPMPVNDIVFAMPKPVTITGVTVTPKMYDAGTAATLDFSSAVINGINPGNFVNINSTFATGTFADKHVGTGKPVTIINTALSSPGLDANAYVLSAQPAANGNITQRPLTVTAAANTKTYDGNTSAAAIPVITPAGPTGLQGSDVAAFTETYDTKNAGTNKTLTPAGIVNDGNSGNNYAYNFVPANTGIINYIPITNLSATPGSIACNGGTTTITVSASGGDGALQYSLSGTASFPYQSSTVFTGVGAGTYTLTVKDEDNFTEQLTGIVVGQPGVLSATIVKTNVSACVAVNGTITVTPAGGSGVYNYSWTGLTGIGATSPFTAGNVSSVSGLDIGYYNVTITDDNGCGVETISNIHIQYAFSVVVTNSGSTTSACGNTGSIILYGNAGVQPYTYSIDGTNYQAGNTFTGLAAGTYTGYVKDAAGCVGTKPNIVIAAAAPIVVSPFVRNASSCSNDGSIEIYRTGGIPPYTYSMDNITYQAGNVFSGLAAGNYTVYVKDSKGCIGSQPATVAQGAALSLSIIKTNSSTCTNDGTIRINVTGGIAPFTYSKDGVNYQASNLFTGLAQGNYTVYAKDSKGCTGTTNVTINLNTITVTSYVVNTSTCASSNGSIQLFRAGGVGPYMYSLDGNTYQASNLFTNLAPGTYDGYVQDSKGCIGVQNGITVSPGCIAPPVAGGVNAKPGLPASIVEPELSVIRAYPNPSSHEFTLVLDKGNDEQVEIIVTDITGRQVYRIAGTGKQQYRFGNGFMQGIYLVQVTRGDKKQYLKLIKS